MKGKLLKVADFYLQRPIVFDFVLIGMVFLVYSSYDLNSHNIVELSRVDNFLSNITSALVSLIGFILASLTIIVSVKSNIKSRTIQELENGLELLLSTNNYRKIVKVFKDSIFELTICLIAVYIFWTLVRSVESRINYLIIYGVATISLCILRSVILLFKLISLEFKTRKR